MNAGSQAKATPIKLYGKDGKPQDIAASGLGNRPSLYPFRQMDIGDYFTIPAPKDQEERRKASMRLYCAASHFGSRNPPFSFSTHYVRSCLVVTRTG